MKLLKPLKYGVVAVILILLTGCTVFRDRSIGDRNQITVIADLSVWQSVSAPLSRIFERVIETPQPEKLYYLERVDYAKLAEISRRPNILVVAPLKSAEPVSVFLSNALSAQVADGVYRGDYYVFEKTDLWARDQQVLFLTAPDVNSLSQQINAHSSELYDLFNDHRNQVIQREMYARLEQKPLENELFDKYGWRLRIQHDYKIIFDDSDRRLVQMKRNHPDRWLTIHWNDGDDSYRSLENTAAVRDTLGKWFYDPVFSYPDYHRFHEMEFAGRPAGLLTGLWATESDIGGGPFFTYVIYDSLLQRTFFIDGAVFAPHDVKEPFLRQLQIMARTFVPTMIL
jgi:hypothetical protein